MSDALYLTARTLETAQTAPRRLPTGYGLMIGASASLGLWAGVIWALVRAFG